jgi:LCP family protein required for cell wall assembly
MTVASIDSETGKTVLISLPRNMQNFPFRPGSVMARQFPHGFNLEGMYLNGVSTWAGDHTTLFKKSKTPGVDATISAVEGITGLRINYWAMVNLAGFRELVDAVGGVRLTVRQPIPVGLPSDKFFHYIKPGTRTLDGMDTLWFSRARYDSDDYSRMARQKCVMAAMLRQVSPQSAVTNFQAIAKASSDMVSTNLPAGELGKFMQLALAAKSQKIATLSLVPPMIDTAHPDIALVQAKVQAAIATAEGRPVPTPAPAPTTAGSTAPASSGTTPAPASGSATPAPAKRAKPKAPSTITGGSLGSRNQGYAANQSDNLAASC